MSSPDTTDQRPSSSASQSPVSLLHGRVLIAVHDPAAAEEMRLVLTHAGAEVSLARDGQGALDAVAAQAPELLLLDVALADPDSAAVSCLLKAQEATRYLPVVILIGDGAEPERELASGADDFLRHPIHPTELVLRVKLLLRLGRLHQDLADNNSELQAAYEAARESEAKYRALIHDAQDALFLVAPDTATILEANRRALELSGYGEYDLIGQPALTLCDQGPQGQWTGLLHRVTTEGRAAIEDGTLLRKDGAVIPVEMQASLANHHLGEPLIQVLMRDLRPARQLAAERGKADRLAAIVETAVTVNHEINNPLLVIASSVEGLQQILYNADSSVRDKLERIDEASRRIQRFTQQLTSVIAPVSKEYLPGMKMLDLEHSVAATDSAASP